MQNLAGPLHWECGFLTTGPPGKSQEEETSGNQILPEHERSFLHNYLKQKTIT